MILREKSYYLGVNLTILEVRLCCFFHGLYRDEHPWIVAKYIERNPITAKTSETSGSDPQWR